MKVEDYYEINEKIGEGSGGTVFKGKCKVSGKLVAIKVIDIKGENSKEKIENCEREVKILSKLDHPNIVKVL